MYETVLGGKCMHGESQLFCEPYPKVNLQYKEQVEEVLSLKGVR